MEDRPTSSRSPVDREVVNGNLDEGVYRINFDFTTVSPATAIISAVAAVTETDPLQIDPLYSTIDPDALNALFHWRNAQSSDIFLYFSIEGYDIKMTSYGQITIRSASR